MSTWPATLPAVNLAGYSVTPDAGFVRTSMAAGPARQRRIYTANPSTIPASFVFTDAQMSTFKTFYETDLDVGTGWFSLEINAGAGLTTKDCRFVEPYQATMAGGGLWSVSAKMEVRGA